MRHTAKGAKHPRNSGGNTIERTQSREADLDRISRALVEIVKLRRKTMSVNAKEISDARHKGHRR
jgi:hypothetical protein